MRQRKGPSALVLACALLLASCASRPEPPARSEQRPQAIAKASAVDQGGVTVDAAAAKAASSATAAAPAAADTPATAASSTAASSTAATASSTAAKEKAAAAPAKAAAAPKAAIPISPKTAEAQANAAKTAAKAKKSYLEASLADYWRTALPNGAALAVKRQAGRKAAAVRIVLAAGDLSVDKAEAGYAALAFSTALGAASGEKGQLARACLEAEASLRLEAGGSGNLALAIDCPRDKAEGLVLCALRALADPAFDQEDFDLALREERMAARRDSGDPAAIAAAINRALKRAPGRSPAALLPRGTEASLAAATRDSVRRYWSSFFGPARLAVVVVGDFAPAELGGRLAAALASIAGSPSGESSGGDGIAAPQALRPSLVAQGLASTPGSVFLRGDYAAPPRESADYAAMAVALAMLDELLAERLGQASPGEDRLAAGFKTTLSEGAAGEEPSASILIYGSRRPEDAKRAVGAAIAELAGGLCIDLAAQRPPRDQAVSYAKATGAQTASPRAPLARCVEAYRLRAVASEYSRLSSSAALAERIGEDLAAGGDGSALFRMAERIAAVRPEDVARVAKASLGERSAAWAALGDPELLRGLGTALAGR